MPQEILKMIFFFYFSERNSSNSNNISIVYIYVFSFIRQWSASVFSSYLKMINKPINLSTLLARKDFLKSSFIKIFFVKLEKVCCRHILINVILMPSMIKYYILRINKKSQPKDFNCQSFPIYYFSNIYWPILAHDNNKFNFIIFHKTVLRK